MGPRYHSVHLPYFIYEETDSDVFSDFFRKDDDNFGMNLAKLKQIKVLSKKSDLCIH